MARSSRSKAAALPSEIELPPSPAKEEHTSTPPPSPPVFSLDRDPDRFEPSPLSPDFNLAPGLNSPVSPTTPVTPAIILDNWPKDKWDAVGMASPTQTEFFALGNEEKAKHKERSGVISSRLIFFGVLVLLIGLILGSVQYWIGQWAIPLSEECQSATSCFLRTSCSWTAGCSRCARRVFCNGVRA